MSDNDISLDPDERQFTHGEAVEIGEIKSRTLTSWQQRGTLSDLGAMHRTGRRLYSVHDLIQLKIASDLNSLVEMSPAAAAAAARSANDWALAVSREMSRLDEHGKPVYTDYSEMMPNYVLIYSRDGQPQIGHVTGTDWFTKASIPHAVIVLPLNDIIIGVISRAMSVLKREEQEHEE